MGFRWTFLGNQNATVRTLNVLVHTNEILVFFEYRIGAIHTSRWNKVNQGQNFDMGVSKMAKNIITSFIAILSFEEQYVVSSFN